MRCVLTRGHTAGDRLGANWEREPSRTRLPTLSAGSSVAARTHSSPLMAIRGRERLRALSIKLVPPKG